jgi:hypothetical protein
LGYSLRSRFLSSLRGTHITTETKTPETAPKTKKRKGCFFWGCMSTIAVIVIVALVLSIAVFKVPQKIGIVKTATERMMSQTFDRETAAKVTADIKAAGINTTGVEVYVIPEKKSDSSVLLAVLDASKGFHFTNTGANDAISGYLVQMASSCANYGVNRIALEYKDVEGKSLATVTAPTDVITKYSQGKISYEDFLKAIDAKMDIDNLATSGLP